MAITPKGAEREVSGMGKAIRPLIVVVFLAGGAFVGWTKYQERLQQKTIEDLFTYLDAKDYEKAYYQYSDKAHEKYGMTLDYFASIYKGTTKHEILSMTTMQGESLSTHPNQSEAFKKMVKDFSFQDYKNKKLFRVEFYTENPETDIQLYENLERYCSSPGIVVDAYFGVVQEAAFTWKILFFYPLDSKCKGENRYAKYEAEERRKAQEARNRAIVEQRKSDISSLIFSCQRQTEYEAREIPDYDGWAFFDNYREGKEEEIKRENAKRKLMRQQRYSARLDWEEQKEQFCTCLVQKTFSSLSSAEIDQLKYRFWEGGIMKRNMKSCKIPDLYQFHEYVKFTPDLLNTNNR